MTTRRQFPAIPYTSEQTSEEARRAFEEAPHPSGRERTEAVTLHDDVRGESRRRLARAMASVHGRLRAHGDLRVGLEDNFYLPDGRMAASSGELVEAGVKLIRLSGRALATPEEGRQIPWPVGEPGQTTP